MKHYRLWSYTEEVAKKLEEEGFSPGYYGYRVRDWLEDVEKLIKEATDKDISEAQRGGTAGYGAKDS